MARRGQSTSRAHRLGPVLATPWHSIHPAKAVRDQKKRRALEHELAETLKDSSHQPDRDQVTDSLEWMARVVGTIASLADPRSPGKDTSLEQLKTISGDHDKLVMV